MQVSSQPFTIHKWRKLQGKGGCSATGEGAWFARFSKRAYNFSRQAAEQMKWPLRGAGGPREGVMNKPLVELVLPRLAKNLYRELQRFRSGKLSETQFASCFEKLLQS